MTPCFRVLEHVAAFLQQRRRIRLENLEHARCVGPQQVAREPLQHGRPRHRNLIVRRHRGLRPPLIVDIVDHVEHALPWLDTPGAAILELQ